RPDQPEDVTGRRSDCPHHSDLASTLNDGHQDRIAQTRAGGEQCYECDAAEQHSRALDEILDGMKQVRERNHIHFKSRTAAAQRIHDFLHSFRLVEPDEDVRKLVRPGKYRLSVGKWQIHEEIIGALRWSDHTADPCRPLRQPWKLNCLAVSPSVRSGLFRSD